MKFEEIYSHAAIEEARGTGIIKFFATWCLPCRALNTTLKSEEFESYSHTVFSVDVDLEPEICQMFNIKSVPTMVFLKDGVEAARMIGHGSVETIKEFIEKAVNKNEERQWRI